MQRAFAARNEDVEEGMNENHLVAAIVCRTSSVATKADAFPVCLNVSGEFALETTQRTCVHLHKPTPVPSPRFR